MAEENEELKHIVRIMNSDLNGHQQVQMALTGIKGMGRRNARLLAQKAEIDPTETLGMLSDETISKLREIVESAQDHLPVWMKNRRMDLLTGEDKHVMGTDLLLTQREEMDIIRKTRSYRGIRHERGLRVRGQKTRSTGRRGATVGVSRKKK
ncbi:30S ribosomal protein S13 [Methanotrichaceae archaeon M04Ac]|uniref:Small ribosomal subunit protein uS13 n=1 Tax=Candidatus Methanocrinis alkalitolerans TaxID=3033395 RepID=A0ABT5XG43_9EURY|nr:30S ribosomal protein S13 [Candidatus Methanocrinis alkalitolerans]MCR3883247.1 30S ribosomal protein S13 [Methanothrix sp.]MDF0593693.1 30S ribosomal protein S13 [Candidatus Methanocrinis alkalitolerans]